MLFVGFTLRDNFGVNISLDDLFLTCDAVVIHIHSSPENLNLISHRLLSITKKGFILVNTSRGGVVNEKDLNEALNKKIIFGAGLDVFEKEPPDSNNPLLTNERVTLSPHAATFTQECLSEMSKETAQNLINFFEGKLSEDSVVKI